MIGLCWCWVCVSQPNYVSSGPLCKKAKFMNDVVTLVELVESYFTKMYSNVFLLILEI